MSLFSPPRDGSFFGNRDLSRKARRTVGRPRSSDHRRRARTRAAAWVELLEPRTLLSAIVTTDKSDYAPGSTAYITATNNSNPGTDFQPGETVQFHIDRTDGIPVEDPPAIQTWDVTDGLGGFAPYQDSNGLWWFPDTDGAANGTIDTTWYVDPQFAGRIARADGHRPDFGARWRRRRLRMVRLLAASSTTTSTATAKIMMAS